MLAPHVSLSAAFTGGHQDVAAQVAFGSTAWLAQFTVLVAIVTSKRIVSLASPDHPDR